VVRKLLATGEADPWQRSPSARRTPTPYASTAARLPGLIKDLTFVTVEGGPHNIAWTFPDVVNPALLALLGK
jgi:pimeloyl-ACP methyl ester carboxylesterase